MKFEYAVYYSDLKQGEVYYSYDDYQFDTEYLVCYVFTGEYNSWLFERVDVSCYDLKGMLLDCNVIRASNISVKLSQMVDDAAHQLDMHVKSNFDRYFA